MADVYVQSFCNQKWFQLDRESFLSYGSVVGRVLGVSADVLDRAGVPIKVFHGCREIVAGADVPWPREDAFLQTTISLNGGKGGFGSMLRAIGAQIEKTTNREACRDLSGRRLRDINEEKRLKDWVAKKAEREREREEKKQKKLEKLRQEFRFEFHDPEYNKIRAEVSDKVHEAIEQGMEAASSSSDLPQRKRKAELTAGKPLKKTALWVGVSDDEDTSDSSCDSDKSDLEPPTASSTDEAGSSNDQSIQNMIASQAPPATTTTAEKPVATEETPTPPSPPPQTSAPAAEEAPPAPLQTTQPTAAEPATTTTVSEPVTYDPINLDDYTNVDELESLGLNHLKAELERRNLKCGGTLKERASRLLSVKGLSDDDINPAIRSKPTKKK